MYCRKTAKNLGFVTIWAFCIPDFRQWAFSKWYFLMKKSLLMKKMDINIDVKNVRNRLVMFSERFEHSVCHFQPVEKKSTNLNLSTLSSLNLVDPLCSNGLVMQINPKDQTSISIFFYRTKKTNLSVWIGFGWVSDPNTVKISLIKGVIP